jgi:hypothetical protein
MEVPCNATSIGIVAAEPTALAGTVFACSNACLGKFVSSDADLMFV